MIIAIDMMGGDFAPEEAVKGIAEYFQQHDSPLTLALIGDKDAVEKHLAGVNIPADKYKLVPSTQVIDMHEHPTKALKEKPDRKSTRLNSSHVKISYAVF